MIGLAETDLHVRSYPDRHMRSYADENHAMTAQPSVDPAPPWIEQIDRAEADLLRALLKAFV